jgi:ATP synthase protein I
VPAQEKGYLRLVGDLSDPCDLESLARKNSPQIASSPRGGSQAEVGFDADSSIESAEEGEDVSALQVPSPEPSRSMEDFYSLKRQLFLFTALLIGPIFGGLWYFYGLSTALSYLVGSLVGLVYFRLLARNVERLSQGSGGVSQSRMALFIGLMIVATQRQELQVIPVIFGFLTYKLAIFAYTLRITLAS